MTEYSCCAPRAKLGSGGQLYRGRMTLIGDRLRCNVCAREAAPEPSHG